MRSQTRPRFEKALDSEEPLQALRNELGDLLDEGWSRDALLKQLESDRAVLRSVGRSSDEDILLEAMDFLTGWSSPHTKL